MIRSINCRAFSTLARAASSFGSVDGFLTFQVIFPLSSFVASRVADGTVIRLPQQNLAALVAVLRVLRGEPLDLSNAEGGHA